MAKPKLVSDIAPRRSPERKALAAAIKRHAAADARIARITSALEKAKAMQRGAFADADAADKRLQEAKSTQGHATVARLLGEEDKAGHVGRNARAEAAKAKREIDDAEAAAKILQTELTSWERERKFTDQKIREATLVVVKSEWLGVMERELREAKAVQADLVARRSRLRAFHQTGCAGNPEFAQPSCSPGGCRRTRGPAARFSFSQRRCSPRHDQFS